MTETTNEQAVSTDGQTTTTRKPKLLPANLAALAEIAAKENLRYPLSGIHLRTPGDDTYLAEATDGRFAARITGTVGDIENYPSLPALNAAPNGAMDTVIPSDAWRAAFKAIPKGKQAKNNSHFAQVAVVQGDQVTTLATTNGESQTVLQPANLDARYPNIADVIPSGQPSARVNLSAELLAKLLKVAAQFTNPDLSTKITLEIYGATPPSTAIPPIVITAQYNGQKFTGLLMPMS